MLRLESTISKINLKEIKPVKTALVYNKILVWGQIETKYSDLEFRHFPFQAIRLLRGLIIQN
jgi:hypothetical protein